MSDMDWRKGFAEEYAAQRAIAVDLRKQGLAARIAAENQVMEAEQRIALLDQGARAFGVPVENTEVASGNGAIATKPIAATPEKPSQFKDIALELLKEAFPRPVKAAHVQSAAEAETGRVFHWKTAGMTLYRLKQDGLARREGQNWYFVPPAQSDLEELLG
jgi:hypothetical protein